VELEARGNARAILLAGELLALMHTALDFARRHLERLEAIR
jgi:hypothetical protein